MVSIAEPTKGSETSWVWSPPPGWLFLSGGAISWMRLVSHSHGQCALEGLVHLFLLTHRGGPRVGLLWWALAALQWVVLPVHTGLCCWVTPSTGEHGDGTCSCPLCEGPCGLGGCCVLCLLCASQTQTCNLCWFSWIEKTLPRYQSSPPCSFEDSEWFLSSSLLAHASPLQLPAWDIPPRSAACGVLSAENSPNQCGLCSPQLSYPPGSATSPPRTDPSCQSPIWSDHLVCFWIKHSSHNISVYFNNCIPCIGNEPRWSKAGGAKHVMVVIAFALPISNFTV